MAPRRHPVARHGTVRLPDHSRLTAMTTDSSTGERAISALEGYWSDIGRAPDPRTVERLRAAIEGRLADGGYGTHWQSLLDDALADLDHSVDWDGPRVRSIVLWGSPPA